MSTDKREVKSFLEDRLVGKGNTIVVNNYLPEGTEIEEPPNKIFKQDLIAYKECNPDNTMSVVESRMKAIIGIAVLGGFICVILFMMFQGGGEKNYHAYKSLTPKDVTEVKNTPINEVTVLQTHSADDPKKPGLFGNKKVGVGDKVGYENSDANLVDVQGRNRNFNTPLVIVASTGLGGRSSSNEKLAIPASTAAYVYLERDVMTGNLNAPVTAVTYLDVKVNGKTVLPKGARLIGQCQSVTENRVQITFDDVIFPDGREYGVRGMALGDDNLVGVAGDINRNVAKKTGNLFASSLLDAAAQSMSITGDSFGTVFAGNVAENTGDSFGNAIDDSAARSGMTIKVAANMRFKVLFE